MVSSVSMAVDLGGVGMKNPVNTASGIRNPLICLSNAAIPLRSPSAINAGRSVSSEQGATPGR